MWPLTLPGPPPNICTEQFSLRNRGKHAADQPAHGAVRSARPGHAVPRLRRLRRDPRRRRRRLVARARRVLGRRRPRAGPADRVRPRSVPLGGGGADPAERHAAHLRAGVRPPRAHRAPEDPHRGGRAAGGARPGRDGPRPRPRTARHGRRRPARPRGRLRVPPLARRDVRAHRRPRAPQGRGRAAGRGPIPLPDPAARRTRRRRPAAGDPAGDGREPDRGAARGLAQRGGRPRP